jgi:hypothetical protein
MNVSNTYTYLSSKAFTLRPWAAPPKLSAAAIIESPSLLVFRDKDVISSKRPAKYGEREEEEVRRSPSDSAMLSRSSRVRSLRPDSYAGNSITEKGDRDYQATHHKRQFAPITRKIVSSLTRQELRRTQKWRELGKRLDSRLELLSVL